MYKDRSVNAIITAAGSGTRMGTQITKQFIKVGKMTILERTIRKILNSKYIDNIILVIKKDEEKEINGLINGLNINKTITLTYGGNSREESTFNGIKSLDKNTDIVLMHDGARPFIRTELLDRMIEATDEHRAIICAVPAKDTIKIITNDMKVKSTPERSRLYMVQTPQIFDYKLILKAYESVDYNSSRITDDASLIEAIGEEVYVYHGDYNNIKITTNEDLVLANILAQEEDDENR